MAGATPGQECLREDGLWRPQAGETRPAGVSVGGGDDGLTRVVEMLSYPDVAGRSVPVVPAEGSSSVGTANPVGSDGLVVAGGPVGPCETLSPLFHDTLGPLEHSVPDEMILGLDHSLQHSGLDHAGPVGRHVAGGPVGQGETLLGLDPLEHSGLDRADPAGQHAAVGPVGLFGMLSPSDCYPAGPAGPYVAGGPVGPDEKFQVLDPLEHSGPDHADPTGQHAIFQDVLEPLEHLVLDTALDGRPMAGVPSSETDRAFGSGNYPGHFEMTIDEEPLAHSVLDVTLDGWPMEGIPVPEPLEHSVPGGGGGGPGQRTHGGDVTFRTVRAFGSECSPRQLL